jgi:hypothetical protein
MGLADQPAGSAWLSKSPLMPSLASTLTVTVKDSPGRTARTEAPSVAKVLATLRVAL